MRCVNMVFVIVCGLGLTHSANARQLLSTPADILKQAFPDQTAASTLVQGYDFEANIKNGNYLKVMLAPAFGKLDSDSVKLLSDEVKVMIAGVTRSIARQPVGQRDWDTVLSQLNQNILIKPMNDSQIWRSDKFVTQDTDYFSFDGLSPDWNQVKEVETWFYNFVNDEDIVNQTGIDINVIVDMIAATSTIVDNLLSGYFDDAYEERNILDVAVLRYPDVDQPYFKLFRLQLGAYVESSRFVAVQEDTFGISGELHVSKYEPRVSVLKKLSQMVTTQATAEADALFQ